MNKKATITVALIAVSTVLMIYKAETTYQHLEAGSKWARAFGNGFGPWFFGLIVAGIKEVWARLRKRNHNFSGSLQWATGVLTVFIVLAAVLSSEKANANGQTRDDAMLLMGAATWVPGLAAYCNKYVEPNKDLLAAAQSWNQRHNADLKKIVSVVKATGGLTKDEKRAIDQLTMRMLKQEVDSQSDKQAYCKQVETALTQRLLDLEQREDTAQAIKRVRAYRAGK